MLGSAKPSRPSYPNNKLYQWSQYKTGVICPDFFVRVTILAAVFCIVCTSVQHTVREAINPV